MTVVWEFPDDGHRDTLVFNVELVALVVLVAEEKILKRTCATAHRVECAGELRPEQRESELPQVRIVVFPDPFPPWRTRCPPTK